jgi:hypothetical protein
MRLAHASALAVAIALLIPAVNAAPQAQDPDRKVAGGGISVPGWMGAADKGSVNDSKFAAMGNDLHLTIGPAAVYWNPKNTATGNYTVSATFKELKPGMGGHPHPVGPFVAGSSLDTDKKTALYCTVSTGGVLVRGFNGGTVFTLTTGRGAVPNDAVAKPAADGTVTNTIALSVKDGTVECLVNGKSVGSYTKDQHKLASTDGIYGIRVSHNMEVMVSGLAKK